MSPRRTVNGQHKYQVIAEAMAQEIAAGKFPPKSLLPSRERLAERFDCSQMTVRQAMLFMERQGLVEVRHGVGVSVPAKRPEHWQFTSDLRDAVATSLANLRQEIVMYEDMLEREGQLPPRTVESLPVAAVRTSVAVYRLWDACQNRQNSAPV